MNPKQQLKRLFNRRNWRIFIFLGIGLLVLRFFYNPFEPHYQGKSLSAWVAILSENNSGSVLSESGQRQRLLAAKAVIEKADHVQLSERDSLRVLDLLENPPAPNAKLLAAARALPKRR